MWKLISAALATLGALVLYAAPAQAQVTEAQVIQQCKDKTPLPNANWTYKVAFTNQWSDVQWGVQNPFPGRNPGDVHVELMVSAAANFSCTPDLNGSNPNNLPTFTIPVTPRGVAYLGDEKVCANDGSGQSKMILAFPGAACPWPYRSGFPDIAQFTGQVPNVDIGMATSTLCNVYGPLNFDPVLRHPIILWGNGTGGSAASYESLFAYWASYGFVVIAANTPNSGTGNEMLACLDSVLANAAQPTSPFYRHLNPYRIAAAGHSQGGGGAIMAGSDARVGATIPFMPYILPIGGVTRHDAAAHGQQKGPMLLISGANDPLATPTGHQLPVFNTVNQPVFWATEKAGAHGLDVPMARASLPFLRWQLMQHDLGAAYFTGPACTLCTDPAWTVQKRGIP